MQQIQRMWEFFSLPNEVFLLGLSAGELAVYSFLKRCENRKTHQCWPSTRTLGDAVHMSENTVHKYIRQLEDRGLISAEPTEVITKYRGRRSGSRWQNSCESRRIPPDHLWAAVCPICGREAESLPLPAVSSRIWARFAALRGTKLGPRRNPTKWFRWGEEEQRKERVFAPLGRKRGSWSL